MLDAIDYCLSARRALQFSDADFYRLERPSEAEELGLDDYREGAALIAEWPEKAGGFAHEPGCLSIALEIAGSGRKAIVEPGRLLSAREIRERVYTYYGCAEEAHHVISEKAS